MKTKEERRTYWREWRRKNRERENAKARARYRKKPPDRRAYQRKWYAEHLEHCREVGRANMARRRQAGLIRPEDAAKKSARRRRYRDEHRDREKAQTAAWMRAKLAENPNYRRERYLANQEAMIRAARAAYWKNPQRWRDWCREWRRKNPDAVAAHKARRRIRERAAIVERVDRQAIYDRDGGVCHLCRRPVERTRFTLDHLVPLARGGEHAAYNVAVAHRRCNLRKHARVIPVQVPLPLSRRAVPRIAP